MASYVWSLELMPVPPVVTIACTRVIGEPSFDRPSHALRIVRHDRLPEHLMSTSRQEIDDRASSSIGLLGTRVADRQDGAVDRVWCCLPMYQVTHRPIIATAPRHTASSALSPLALR